MRWIVCMRLYYCITKMIRMLIMLRIFELRYAACIFMVENKYILASLFIKEYLLVKFSCIVDIFENYFKSEDMYYKSFNSL